MPFVSMPSPDSTSSIVRVDSVASLRSLLTFPSPDVSKTYITKNYSVSTDTGSMAYRWNASDASADDGVLHIKASRHGVGRFQPVKPPDGMMNAQACGPALTDIGSITRSFDPTAARAIGSELKRISTILRNSGWTGIYLGSDLNGSRSYAVNGTETLGRSSTPFIPFSVVGVDGAEIVSFTPPSPSGLSIYAETEIDILTVGYGPRYWTQTVVGGDTVFTGVSDRTGLSVGDWMMIRLGADNSDEGGVCYCYFFGQIKTITPGAGATATIETWQCAPETPSSAVYPSINNTLRQYNKHDMLKVVGFQDGTTISGFNMNRTSISLSGYRNLTIDCVWPDAPLTCINGLYGDGLDIPSIVVHRAQGYDGGDNALAFVTLAKQYNTHIGSMIVYDTSPTPLNARPPSILTTESLCRGVRVDLATLTIDAKGNTCQFGGQTPYQTDLISVGMVVIKGSSSGLLVGGNARMECVDYKGVLDVGFLEFPFNTKSLVYAGQMYTKQNTGDYAFPIFQTATKVYTLPNHGLTSGFRIWISSMTGVSTIEISGDGFTVRSSDITSSVTAGQWIELNQAQALFGLYPNQAGYNGLGVRITTTGSFPLGGYMAVRHTTFEIDTSSIATSVADTTIPSKIVTNGAPAANSAFVGQECFDSTNSAWYMSVATGTGASDWKKLTP